MASSSTKTRLGIISIALALVFSLAFSFSGGSAAFADESGDCALTVASSNVTTAAKKPIKNAKVSVKKLVYYNGKAKTPKVTVKYNGRTLAKGKSYTVKYSNNVKPGTAKITITGKGNYKGTKTVTFKIVRKGWSKIKGKWYFYNSQGKRVKGVWKKHNGNWKYLTKKTGAAARGFFTLNGVTYYANSAGVMQTGWKKLASRDTANAKSWYYFYSSGAMAKKWNYIGGNWYYFAKKTGQMYSNGTIKLSGNLYYLKKSGACVIGPQWYKDRTGKWVYAVDSSGKLATGWKYIGSAWYYFSSSNAQMYSNGRYQIGDSYYYFNSDGSMHVGWLYKNSRWYFYSSSGWQCGGWNRIGGQWFYFGGSDGHLMR